MFEINATDNKEIKNGLNENYKNIKPDRIKNSSDARTIIKGIFSEEKEKYNLTESDKSDLVNGGMSEGILDKCVKDESGIINVRTPNEDKLGNTYSDTGVNSQKNQVEIGGHFVEIKAPQFESKCDCILPKELLRESDSKQFKECNRQLYEKVQSNPKWAEETFTSEQLEQIKDGNQPRGLTWHHDVEVGEMKLVETKIHNIVPHIGGKALWGGGSSHR